MSTTMRITVALLVVCASLQCVASADPCPYLICINEYPAGTLRPMPGSDYVCCDYENRQAIPSPCEGDKCYLEAQYFGTDAGCVCAGEGNEEMSATSVFGSFLSYRWVGSCDFEERECDYQWDGNDPDVGLTLLCINCS